MTKEDGAGKWGEGRKERWCATHRVMSPKNGSDGRLLMKDGGQTMDSHSALGHVVFTNAD